LFFRSGYTRARHRKFLLPAPNYHTVSYVSSLLPALCLPRAPRLQAASLREFAHMQADQCGSQMGTKFWEVVCDEHSIGGDGEYCSVVAFVVNS
jgi:hypothetical protein